MRVYVAAPWSKKNEASAIASTLEARGLMITQRWWEHPETTDIRALRQQASADLRGVQDSDVFVYLGLGKSEGKATELGYALAYGRPVVAYVPLAALDPHLNLFLYHTRVRTVSTLADLLFELNILAKEFAYAETTI